MLSREHAKFFHLNIDNKVVFNRYWIFGPAYIVEDEELQRMIAEHLTHDPESIDFISALTQGIIRSKLYWLIPVILIFAYIWDSQKNDEFSKVIAILPKADKGFSFFDKLFILFLICLFWGVVIIATSLFSFAVTYTDLEKDYTILMLLLSVVLSGVSFGIYYWLKNIISYKLGIPYDEVLYA